MTNLEKIKERLPQLVLDLSETGNVIVGGGFVRDSIVGRKNSRDIDLYVVGADNFQSVLMYLVGLGDNVTNDSQSDTRLKFDYEGNTYDILYVTHGETEGDIMKYFDYRLNCVCYSPKRDEIFTSSEHNLDDVLSDIKNKVLKPLNGICYDFLGLIKPKELVEFRLEKYLAYGFTMSDEDKATYETLLKKCQPLKRFRDATFKTLLTKHIEEGREKLKELNSETE